MAKKVKNTPQAVLDLIEQQPAKIQQLEKANASLDSTLSRASQEEKRLHAELQVARERAAAPSSIYVIMRDRDWIWDVFDTESTAISALKGYAKSCGMKLIQASAASSRYQLLEPDGDGWCHGTFYIQQVHIRTK